MIIEGIQHTNLIKYTTERHCAFIVKIKPENLVAIPTRLTLYQWDRP